MTNYLPPQIKFQPFFLQSDGTVAPLPGGKVVTYAAGTTTPLATYASDGTTPNPTTIILDANGACDMRLRTVTAYKINVTDANGVQQVGYPVDNVTSIDMVASGIYATLAGTSPVQGAGLIGAKADFVGAISRSQDDKNNDYVTIEDFGAIGDGDGAGGGTDNAAAINLAFTRVPAGGVVRFGQGKIYRIDSAITTPVRCSIDGNGATLDYTNFTTGYPFLFGGVSAKLSTTLSAPALIAGKALDLTNSAPVVEGDMILLESSTQPWPWDPRPGEVCGELNRVKAVGTGTVDVDIQLSSAYTSRSAAPYPTGTTVTVWTPWKNCFIKDLKFTRAKTLNTIGGLIVSRTECFVGENLEFENFGAAGITDIENFMPSYTNVKCRDLWYATIGLGYGIQTVSSTFVTIINSKFINCRRAVDLSGVVPTRFSIVSNCIAEGLYTLAAGNDGVTGFGTHGTAEYNVFVDCTVSGCYNGFLIRGAFTTLQNCIGYGMAGDFVTLGYGHSLIMDGCATKAYSTASGTSPVEVGQFLTVSSPDAGEGLGVKVFNANTGVSTAFISLGSGADDGIKLYLRNCLVRGRTTAMYFIKADNSTTGAKTATVYRDSVTTFGGNLLSPLADSIGTGWTKILADLSQIRTSGANVASASTIALTGDIQHVTGTDAIDVITLPFTGFIGERTLIPDDAWTFTVSGSGNIAKTATAVAGVAMKVTYDGTKWYPSY